MFRFKSGFTLIELLVVITLIGISITLATPSWDKVSQKRRVTNVAEQATAFLVLAQGEAQKRNQPVSLSYHRSGNRDWCIGATVGADGCDCAETDPASAQYCAIDGIANTLQAPDFPLLNLLDAVDTQPNGGDSHVTFDPIRGILQPAGDSLQLTFESERGAFRLRIRLGPTGLLMVCSPDVDKKVAGYATCAS
jgi:type II secretion system protein H